MKKLLDKYQARRARRQDLSLACWEQERLKGKARYVLKQALTWAVLMVAIRDVYEQIFDGGSSNVLHYFIIYSLGGLFVGYGAWSTREATYRDALRARRLKMPFDERIKPR